MVQLLRSILYCLSQTTSVIRALSQVRLSALLQSVVLVLGFSLSLWLGISRVLLLPCSSWSDCGAITASKYGAVFGIPVGLIGATIWLIIMLCGNLKLRRVLHVSLAAGSIWFTFAQAVLLRSFCPLCLGHALLTWIALFCWRKEKNVWLPIPGVIMVVCAVLVSRTSNARPATTIALFDDHSISSGVSLVAPGKVAKRIVVLSLSCDACLERLAKMPSSNIDGDLVLFFKTNDRVEGLTRAFVAGLLAEPGSRTTAFAKESRMLLSLRDLIAIDPDKAAGVLWSMHPNAADFAQQASRMIYSQQSILEKLGLETTPLLVNRSGEMTSAFQF
jgi:uncharacterized membrane protein